MPIGSRVPQITHQACEEGWSFLAEWTGVQLSYVLSLIGVSPQAKYVAFFPYDDSWDSLDLPDAYHPQTFLTYGLNEKDLPTPHGAPILRVARQLSYKSVKYLSHITVTDNLKNIGKGLGSYSPEVGLLLVRRHLASAQLPASSTVTAKEVRHVFSIGRS
jgi:DMSO/TMAO reductase YedYZ molybdopterin-dependent catalytic subunit